ncbi:MAG: thiamine pyrophosphate-dependent dehydrogenase E1 component subunit alpha [Candidatus Bathyarchaeia archaeon]
MPKGTSLTKGTLIHLYELMLKTRRFDECIQQLVDKGVYLPHFHSGWGQEALSVGGTLPLREQDYLLYTHRGYGHLLAKGVPMKKLMADFYCKIGGTNDGMGNIMHSVYPQKGIIGRNGVFGARFGIAAGLGLAAKMKKSDQVVVAFYGEAEGNRGPFFESVNFMTLWKLPVVLVAENNGFSISTRQSFTYPTDSMANMAKSFDIPTKIVDGNNAEIVYAAVHKAVERARKGDGPSLIEGKTYRVPIHKPGDDDSKYRNQQEVEKWRKKDPVLRLRNRLLKAGILSIAAEQELEQSISREIQESVKYAESCVDPAPTVLLEKLYYRS